MNEDINIELDNPKTESNKQEQKEKQKHNQDNKANNEDIIVNESFDDEDEDLFEKIEKKQFESQELLNLKLDSEEISHENEIERLISYDEIKEKLKYNLPHQPEGALKILRDLNGTALLSDEVGLGKTITTGIIIKECIQRGFVKNILILTPPSLVNQWKEELKEKFNLDFNVVENENQWEQKNLNKAIASLDRVKIFDKKKSEFRHKKAHEIPWDLLIVDEAHKLKARSTVRWRFVNKLQKKRFLGLTATPFQNDLIELYNLLHLLKKGHLGTLREFKKKFLKKGNKRHPLNQKELKGKLEEVMVRRTRKLAGIEYKKRVPKIIPVELSDEEYQLYQDMSELLKEQYFSADGSSIDGSLVVYSILPKITSSSKSAIETLSKIANNPKYHHTTREISENIVERYKSIGIDSKMKKLVELVKNIKETQKNPKMLIFTKHPTTLRYIVENFKQFNFNIVEFTGDLNRQEKSERIEQFRRGADVMICTDTGAEGLNFQFCNNIINYDLPWNPMSVEQRIGRLDRIGQERDINVYSFATKDTMEEYVVDLIINKMCCVGLVIGELPIILFNLGLDGNTDKGNNKIEEKLMNSFLNSRNNLNIFSKEVNEISGIIQKEIENYKEEEDFNKKVLDNE
ncbi:MAG TPA: SNF2-related protein [Candidatus Nanoarchaeia archaeon]|nr:SNF2-related protein [Candidatus Nanoarchaeia archaeon]